MIAEDYISFEVAKLLKEKRFDEYVEWAYRYFTENNICVIHINEKPANTLIENCYPYITLQMAMKWLREVHNIIITIHPNSFDADGVYYKADIWFNREYVSSYDIEEREKKVYEESVEDSLKYCLTNLI